MSEKKNMNRRAGKHLSLLFQNLSNLLLQTAPVNNSAENETLFFVYFTSHIMANKGYTWGDHP